jgi:hypothetical protein
MRSDVIVIDGIGSQDPAQMRLAQDDKMVQALAPDRADQPFGKATNTSEYDFRKGHQ